MELPELDRIAVVLKRSRAEHEQESEDGDDIELECEDGGDFRCHRAALANENLAEVTSVLAALALPVLTQVEAARLACTCRSARAPLREMERLQSEVAECVAPTAKATADRDSDIDIGSSSDDNGGGGIGSGGDKSASGFQPGFHANFDFTDSSPQADLPQLALLFRVPTSVFGDTGNAPMTVEMSRCMRALPSALINHMLSEAVSAEERARWVAATRIAEWDERAFVEELNALRVLWHETGLVYMPSVRGPVHEDSKIRAFQGAFPPHNKAGGVNVYRTTGDDCKTMKMFRAATNNMECSVLGDVLQAAAATKTPSGTQFAIRSLQAKKRTPTRRAIAGAMTRGALLQCRHALDPIARLTLT
jgi:hypothetical protein